MADRIKLDDRLADAGFDVTPTYLNDGYGLDARIVTRPVSAVFQLR
ncbi:hypothetical protein [Bifidobacterium sp. SO1]|nr:hypothetical protein [Bifidobacterium sp. SO1]MBT1162865.1 hypothetical protein [Bifidobacterium sp. SO1]